MQLYSSTYRRTPSQKRNTYNFTRGLQSKKKKEQRALQTTYILTSRRIRACIYTYTHTYSPANSLKTHFQKPDAAAAAAGALLLCTRVYTRRRIRSNKKTEPNRFTPNARSSSRGARICIYMHTPTHKYMHTQKRHIPNRDRHARVCARVHAAFVVYTRVRAARARARCRILHLNYISRESFFPSLT